MAGFVTSVIIRVGSVTSTCLRSSAGDIRNRSGPMVAVSSGTLPGQISTISGSAALADHATNNEVTNAAADLKGCMMEFLRHEVFDWHGMVFRPRVRSVSPRSMPGNSEAKAAKLLNP